MLITRERKEVKGSSFFNLFLHDPTRRMATTDYSRAIISSLFSPPPGTNQPRESLSLPFCQCCASSTDQALFLIGHSARELHCLCADFRTSAKFRSTQTEVPNRFKYVFPSPSLSSRAPLVPNYLMLTSLYSAEGRQVEVAQSETEREWNVFDREDLESGRFTTG